MKKVLFICVHNSARSQMAESYLNKFGKGEFKAESAGLEPGKLNPLVVKAMAEDGIDISGNQTKSAFDFYKQGKLYDYVITVCSESEGKNCPLFPGQAKKLHWPFADPSGLEGSNEEKLAETKKIRDQIKEKIKDFIKNN